MCVIYSFVFILMPALVDLISLSSWCAGWSGGSEAWQQQISVADLDTVISASFLNPAVPFFKLSDHYVPCVCKVSRSHKLSLHVFWSLFSLFLLPVCFWTVSLLQAAASLSIADGLRLTRPFSLYHSLDVLAFPFFFFFLFCYMGCFLNCEWIPVHSWIKHILYIHWHKSGPR